MENLVINNKGQLLSRKAIGVIWLCIGLIFIVLAWDSPDKGDWIRFVIFCLIGLIHFTPLVGFDKTRIEIRVGSLDIFWLNRIRKVTVQDSEIESILLATNGVLIRRKGKRDLKLKLFLMNRDQKRLVFEFFTMYAQQKNFIVEK